MVLTEQAEEARAVEPGTSRLGLNDDILWDDEPDPNEAPLPSDPPPLGSDADHRLVLTGSAAS